MVSAPVPRNLRVRSSIRTFRLTGVLILIGLAVFELRCWGRSMREVVQILIRHVLRPHRLRLDVVMLTLPPEVSRSASTGRPRWQT